uniref:Uncharacterized protein n=1 Tax=Oryza barthii TaxID=65489 RepID=A0A0D3FSX9_9ORYZ
MARGGDAVTTAGARAVAGGETCAVAGAEKASGQSMAAVFRRSDREGRPHRRAIAMARRRLVGS